MVELRLVVFVSFGTPVKLSGVVLVVLAACNGVEEVLGMGCVETELLTVTAVFPVKKKYCKTVLDY